MKKPVAAASRLSDLTSRRRRGKYLPGLKPGLKREGVQSAVTPARRRRLPLNGTAAGEAGDAKSIPCLSTPHKREQLSQTNNSATPCPDQRTQQTPTVAWAPAAPPPAAAGQPGRPAAAAPPPRPARARRRPPRRRRGPGARSGPRAPWPRAPGSLWPASSTPFGRDGFEELARRLVGQGGDRRLQVGWIAACKPAGVAGARGQKDDGWRKVQGADRPRNPPAPPA